MGTDTMSEVWTSAESADRKVETSISPYQPIPPFPLCVCEVCDGLRLNGHRGHPDEHPHEATMRGKDTEEDMRYWRGELGEPCSVLLDMLVGIDWKTPEGRAELRRLSIEENSAIHFARDRAEREARGEVLCPPGQEEWAWETTAP